MAQAMKKLFARRKTSENGEPDTAARTTTSPRTTTGGQGGKSTVPTGTGTSTGTGTGSSSAASSATRPAATNAATSGPGHASKGIGPGTGTGTGVPDNPMVQELGRDVTGTGPNGVTSGSTGTSGGVTGKADPLKEDLTELYHPGQLEPLEGRRQDMQNLLQETHALPPPTDQPMDEDFTASYDKQPWELAQEKTRAAEREAASANLAAEKANKALRAAQAAERAVQDAGAKHSELLAEAERQKGLLQDPAALSSSYTNAKQLLAERQAEAERHNKALAALEAEVAAKKKDYDENKPLIESHHKRVSRATEEYEEHIRQQDAIEGDKERLLALSNEAQNEREMATNDVERLTRELMAADDFAAEKERDFINAKEARRVLAAQLAEAKDKHAGAEETWMTHRKKADTAVESADGYVEKSTSLRKQLEEYEEEHTRMMNLEKDREAEYNLAAAKLEGLRAEGDPKRHALAEAEAALNARRAELEEAQKRSKAAEGRYKELMNQADEHALRGHDASQQAKKHLADFDKLRQEAQLHGDKHKQLWNEAIQYGSEGSNAATSAFQKLEQKIENFVHH